MIVYPAIDIRGGRTVRLVQGDFARETAFDADPADAALRWTSLGAEWLHVVDLDAAIAGEPVNVEAIQSILRAVDVPLQVGGGMRSVKHVEDMLALGVERVVIGTKAVHDPEFVEALLEQWGDQIAIGLDAREGKLASEGWLEQSDVIATEVAARMVDAGVGHIVATDIARDGTLSGPNLPALTEMVAIAGERIIASGGVGSLADVEAVRDAGAGGVIVGRALYDGRVDLGDAIRTSAPTRAVR